MFFDSVIFVSTIIFYFILFISCIIIFHFSKLDHFIIITRLSSIPCCLECYVIKYEIYIIYTLHYQFKEFQSFMSRSTERLKFPRLEYFFRKVVDFLLPDTLDVGDIGGSRRASSTPRHFRGTPWRPVISRFS